MVTAMTQALFVFPSVSALIACSCARVAIIFIITIVFRQRQIIDILSNLFQCIFPQ